MEGKSQVRKTDCRFKKINKWLFACSYPVRPASGTVSLINRFMNIFEDMGFGRSWNMALGLRNPF